MTHLRKIMLEELQDSAFLLTAFSNARPPDLCSAPHC